MAPPLCPMPAHWQVRCRCHRMRIGRMVHNKGTVIEVATNARRPRWWPLELCCGRGHWRKAALSVQRLVAVSVGTRCGREATGQDAWTAHRYRWPRRAPPSKRIQASRLATWGRRCLPCTSSQGLCSSVRPTTLRPAMAGATMATETDETHRSGCVTPGPNCKGGPSPGSVTAQDRSARRAPVSWALVYA